MKGFLLAGCAAVALVGLCGPAAADTTPGKFDIKIGGDAYFTVGAVAQSYERNTRSTEFTNRFRLQVTPKAQADNGIEYGANLRVRAWNADGRLDADQAYIFVGGNFGRIEGGVTPGPNNQYGVTAPSGFGTGGVVGDWSEGPGVNTWLNNQATFLEPIVGGGYNNITNTNWSSKLNYFTPRFFGQSGGPDDAPSGLMGMLSFAPSNLSINTDVTRTRSMTALAPAQSECGSFDSSGPVMGCRYDNVWEVGARYDGTFGGFSLSGSAGFIQGGARSTGIAATRTNYNDLQAVQFGGQVGYAGFLVGGSYLNAGNSGYAKTRGLFLTDQSAITAGISYETGPVVVGFNYAHGEDAGDVTVPGTRAANLYSIGATYTLAPGFTTSLEYLLSNTKNERGYGADPLGNGLQNSGNANLFLWKNAITF